MFKKFLEQLRARVPHASHRVIKYIYLWLTSICQNLDCSLPESYLLVCDNVIFVSSRYQDNVHIYQLQSCQMSLKFSLSRLHAKIILCHYYCNTIALCYISFIHALLSLHGGTIIFSLAFSLSLSLSSQMFHYLLRLSKLYVSHIHECTYIHHTVHTCMHTHIHARILIFVILDLRISDRHANLYSSSFFLFFFFFFFRNQSTSGTNQARNGLGRDLAQGPGRYPPPARIRSVVSSLAGENPRNEFASRLWRTVIRHFHLRYEIASLDWTLTRRTCALINISVPFFLLLLSKLTISLRC